MKTRSLRAALLLSCAMLVAAPVALLAPMASATVAAVLPSFSELVKAAQPAVVTVKVESTVGPAVTSNGMPFPDDPAFRDFMERFFGRGFGAPATPPQEPRRAQGLGSGFIVDPSGLIVTNNHVIDGAEKITIVLQNGDEFKGTLVGHDEKTDLAVVRIDADRDLPTVPWGDSDTIEVGDWAIAIGNPFGLGGSVSAGIVSARGRNIQSGPYDDFIQVDTPINRGNSGGPLFDQTGHVIGVNTAIFSPSGGNVGIGFAIPANQAKKIVAELVENGSVERGWLGVSIQPMTGEIAESLGLEDATGALVASVSEDGPAAHGGLKTGDVIMRFGATKIDNVRDLTRAVADTEPGTTSKMTVWRGGKEETLTVETGKMPGKQAAAAPNSLIPPKDLAGLGFTVQPADDGLVVANVDPTSDAAEKGVRPGDVIISVNQEPVPSVEALEKVVGDARAKDRKSVLLLLARGGGQHFVTVDLANA